MHVRMLSALLLLAVAAPFQTPVRGQAPAQGAVELLPAGSMDQFVPPTVFFAGKVASTQARNSGGVRAAGDKVTEFFLVDASGYSTGIRERYQFYVLTSAAIEIGGKRLEPGAYGGGFVNGHALLMNLAAAELFQLPLHTDDGMKRPRPLQVTAGANGGEHRLYLGREYIAFRQVQ